MIGEKYWDEEGIQGLRAEWRFPEVASRFKLIEDSDSIVVNYGNAAHLLELLRSCGPSKQLFRKLQQYSVSVYSGYLATHSHLVEDAPFGLKIWNQAAYNLNIGIDIKLDLDQLVV